MRVWDFDDTVNAGCGCIVSAVILSVAAAVVVACWRYIL